MFDSRNAKAALAGFGLVVAAAALPQSALAQSSTFDEETLDAFVTAQLEVQEIRTGYIERIEGTDSEEERIELSQEANQEMITAVNDAPGISVDEYNAIVEAAGSDPELANRLNEQISEQSQ